MFHALILALCRVYHSTQWLHGRLLLLLSDHGQKRAEMMYMSMAGLGSNPVPLAVEPELQLILPAGVAG